MEISDFVVLCQTRDQAKEALASCGTCLHSGSAFNRAGRKRKGPRRASAVPKSVARHIMKIYYPRPHLTGPRRCVGGIGWKYSHKMIRKNMQPLMPSRAHLLLFKRVKVRRKRLHF